MKRFATLMFFFLALTMQGISQTDVVASVNIEIDEVLYALDTPNKGEATVTTKGNGGYSGELFIPQTITHNGTTYNVTAIGESAFKHCSNLISVSLPITITELGKQAFFGCKGIITIRCDALTPPDIAEKNVFHGMDAVRVTMIVPGQSISLYAADPYWGKFIYNPANDSIRGGENDDIGSVVVTKTNYEIRDSDTLFLEKPITFGQQTTDPAYNEYNMVSYIRNFKNTNWQALYVPVELVYSDWSEKFEVAKIHSILETGEMFYAMADIVTDSIIPHRLYLIRAKEIGEHTITISQSHRNDTDEDPLYRVYTSSLDTLALKPDIATKDTITTANGNSYTFTAQYAKGYIKENNTQPPYRYAMTGGELKRPNPAMPDGIPLGTFRWWLEVTPGANSTVSLFSSGKIDHSGNGETSVDNIIIELNSIEGLDIYYDLNGRRVDSPQKGIYILNGKKVYIE